jgi:hypothetical protein
VILSNAQEVLVLTEALSLRGKAAEEEQRYLAARAKRQRYKNSSLGLVSLSHDETRAASATDNDGSAAAGGYGNCRAVLTAARE